MSLHPRPVLSDHLGTGFSGVVLKSDTGDSNTRQTDEAWTIDMTVEWVVGKV